jgi:pSer/pThr/pTyr-binding forkhead associated (FHA) protein
VVVLNGDEKGCSYELFATPVTLGAAVGNDLSFDDDLVSRNHAVFERRGSAVELVDLNSENGTFVNGDRISRRRLSKGDRVSLGGAIDLEVAG